jgi:hypothetical protein
VIIAAQMALLEGPACLFRVQKAEKLYASKSFPLCPRNGHRQTGPVEPLPTYFATRGMVRFRAQKYPHLFKASQPGSFSLCDKMSGGLLSQREGAYERKLGCAHP